LRQPRGRWGRIQALAPFESALLAVVLGCLVTVLGWRGPDLAAHVYRVIQFQRNGLTLWDSQWYGGHFTLNYSVVFVPIASVLGVSATGVASAAVAAWAFDRLVRSHFGPSARIGSLAFALGTVVQVMIGQLPFLLGEALALAACWAAVRRRWAVAVALAVATSLASPLAGAFLGLAAVSWLLSSWPRNRLGIALLGVGVALPVLVTSVLFPGEGMFPYPWQIFVLELVVSVGLWIIVPREERVLRMATRLYIVAIAVSFVLRSPMGGNVGRLGACLAIPLVVCVLWPHRRWLLVACAVPLGLWQWSPAWAAITQTTHDPSTHRAYYQPLVAFLEAHAQPPSRTEVVPTHLHWEVAYVAPEVALARGWERQVDTADNPLFYSDTALTASTYRAWLVDNGVRYVALSDAQPDYAAVSEAQLVQGGVPGLVPVWSDAHWRVFEVLGSPGIVEGPAHLVSLNGDHLVLDATGPGSILVRVHYSADWSVVGGAGCVARGPGGWTTVDAARVGQIRLELRLMASPQGTC
jgi:hypothetical protein